MGARHSGYLVSGDETEVIEIKWEGNRLFPGIRPEPVSPYPFKISHLIEKGGASVGLATDGEADRLGVVDEKGNPLVYGLLACSFFVP